MKRYYIQSNVGMIKYLVNYHDGVKKHEDGSDFFDIAIFKSKQQLKIFENTLLVNEFVYSTS